MDRLLSAPEPLIHPILIALCDDIVVQARALRYLGELEAYDTAAAIIADASAAGVGSGPPATTRKRKAGAAAGPEREAGGQQQEPAQLCVQCKRAFSLRDNSPSACVHHVGAMEGAGVNERWASGFVHQMEEENAMAHPEGFVWSCCQRNGARSGCTTGYHRAVRHSQFKRMRLNDLPPAPPSPAVERVFEGRVLRANEFVNETGLEGGGGVGAADCLAVDSSDMESEAVEEEDEVGSEQTETRSEGSVMGEPES